MLHVISYTESLESRVQVNTSNTFLCCGWRLTGEGSEEPWAVWELVHVVAWLAAAPVPASSWQAPAPSVGEAERQRPGTAMGGGPGVAGRRSGRSDLQVSLSRSSALCSSWMRVYSCSHLQLSCILCPAVRFLSSHFSMLPPSQGQARSLYLRILLQFGAEFQTWCPVGAGIPGWTSPTDIAWPSVGSSQQRYLQLWSEAWGGAEEMWIWMLPVLVLVLC